MEISRYASRLAARSPILPSARPLQPASSEAQPAFESVGDRRPPNTLPLKAPDSLPQEPDDARLTGGTRSLSRRLLALNIPGIPVTGLSEARETAAAASRNSPAQKPRARKSVPANHGIVPHRA